MTAHLPYRIIPVVAGMAAVICALLAQHPTTADRVPDWVIGVSLGAVIGAAVALPGVADRARELPIGASERARRIVLCAALLLCPALGAALIWHGLGFQYSYYGEITMSASYTSSTATWAALLWLAGLIAGLAVAWYWQREPGAEAASSRPPHSARGVLLEVATLAAILSLAAVLRIWHLGTLPEGIWFDEVESQKSAVPLLNMPFQPFAAGNVGHIPSLYFYVMALLLKVGGTSMGTIRLTSALFGLVAVVAVYLLGRQVGGASLGLCAAALLAVAQWAITFSRIGMSNISAPALLGLGFTALVVAMRRPRAFWFALSGIVLGLSLLTYAGGFLAAGGVAIGVVGLRTLTDRRFRQAAWPAMLLLPAGLLAGGAPLLTALVIDPSFTLDRENLVSLFHQLGDWPARFDGLKENLRAHLLMFTVAGDQNGRQNLPGAPMLDVVTGTCFLLGLGICLRRLHLWLYQLLLLWLFAGMLGGILSLTWEAPQGGRTIGAIVPIALIAAMPLVLLGRIVRQGTLLLPAWAARRAKRAAHELRPAGPARLPLPAALAALAVLCPLGLALAENRAQYFDRQATNLKSWQDMDGRLTIMGRAVAELQHVGYTVRVDPTITAALTADEVLNYAAGMASTEAYDASVPVPPRVPGGGLALIIPSDRPDVLQLVQATVPHAGLIPLTPNFDHSNVQARVLVIRPRDVAPIAGITATFRTGTQLVTYAHQPADLAWPTRGDSTSSATLRGTLLIDSAQSWQPFVLRVAGAREASISIDGEAWPLSAIATPILRLGAGSHALLVQARGKAGPRLVLQLATSAGWVPLPQSLLAGPGMPTGGLLGSYFSGPAIGGPPAMVRVDRTIHTYYQTPPVGSDFPFAAQWLGVLKIAHAGNYAFQLDSTGPSTLYIDGAVAATSGTNAPGRQGTRLLVPGRHSLQLDYHATGSYLHCYLSWAPPGQSFAPIPVSDLDPAHG